MFLPLITMFLPLIKHTDNLSPDTDPLKELYSEKIEGSERRPMLGSGPGPGPL
jgi:hypothetical protein